MQVKDSNCKNESSVLVHQEPSMLYKGNSNLFELFNNDELENTNNKTHSSNSCKTTVDKKFVNNPNSQNSKVSLNSGHRLRSSEEMGLQVHF